MTLAILGCGNPNRSDDGVGPAVVRLLRDRDLPPDVQLHDAGTDGMGVLYRAKGCSHLIIVDARAPETAPGAIYDVPGEVLEATPPRSFGLHDFRWDHALYAGRRLYGADFPRQVCVYLVEAQSLDFGVALTPIITDAARRVSDLIEARCHDFAAGRW